MKLRGLNWLLLEVIGLNWLSTWTQSASLNLISGLILPRQQITVIRANEDDFENISLVTGLIK